VEGHTDKLTINALGVAKAGLLLGHPAPDKPGGVEDDFADMPSLEDASDHKSRQGLPTQTSDFPETRTLRNSPAVMQAKGSESHAPFDAHHVEVLTPVVVSPQLHLISPQRVKSPAHTIALTNTQIDGHHEEVSATVTVPSPSLVLKNHFSSFDGLDTTDVGGDPYIGTSTTIVEPQKAKSLGDAKALSLVLQNHFSSLDGLENTNVLSKFWADPNEMEEDDSDTGEEIVCTKRKPGRPPKRNGKSKKTAKTVLSTTSQ